MKLKLLLIRPNSKIERSPPPLGLLSIAAWLRREDPDIVIRIIDGRLHNWSLVDFSREISSFTPDIVGITTMHADALETHELSGLVKHLIPTACVVLGGAYPTSDYATALQDQHVDYAVVGEGERPFEELIRSLKNGKQGDSIAGVVSRKHLPDFPVAGRFVEFLDNLPLPAWDLISIDDYFVSHRMTMENPMQLRVRAVPVMSSRGCPFRCIFCHHIFGKEFRQRTTASMVSEIEHLIDTYKIQEIEIIDDTFNLDMHWAKEFFALMITRKITIPICFSNGIRIDRVDNELLELMKQTGVYRINFGIESASPRIQKLIKKELNLNTAKTIVDETVKRGILAGGFFMIGFPGETAAEMRKTIDFAVELSLHTAVFAMATPFPGTELHHIATGTIPQSVVLFSTVGKPTLNTSAVSDEDLIKFKASAYRRFYFNPNRIWRILKDTPSWRHLIKNFVEVFNVAFLGKELYGKRMTTSNLKDS